MVQEITPGHDAQGHRFCVVASRFNHLYVERMVQAALEVLRGRGAAEDDLTVVWVPGSFELPITCRWAAASGRYDAVLAFGAIVRGETDHHRLVADVAAHGLLQAMMETNVPVLNGVLAVHDAEQAAARSGGTIGNRGAEVALAAVQMGRLRRELGAR